jgi:hypothetical protein
MCILIEHPAGHSFSDEWLKDFYDNNSDGIGVMYHKDNSIRVNKALPRNVDDMIKFYRAHADGRECLIHLRFRTHGDTDLENCHPYPVFTKDDGYPLWLMHNGILHTGNKADVSKSDTWHYINDIIKPALKADPTQFMEPWFQTLIEEHIGTGNKFAMMDAYGNYQIFNKDAGVMWGDVWMSNTYAWNAHKAGVTKPYLGTGFGGYGAYSGRWDAYDDYPLGTTSTAVTTAKTTTDDADTDDDAEYAKKMDDMMYEDARDYIELFKGELRSVGLQWVLNTLPDLEIEQFYVNYGSRAAYDMLDEIAERRYTGRDILDFFDDMYFGDADAVFDLDGKPYGSSVGTTEDGDEEDEQHLKVGMM